MAQRPGTRKQPCPATLDVEHSFKGLCLFIKVSKRLSSFACGQGKKTGEAGEGVPGKSPCSTVSAVQQKLFLPRAEASSFRHRLAVLLRSQISLGSDRKGAWKQHSRALVTSALVVPRIVVTKYCKLGGLEQQELSVALDSRSPKSRWWQGHIPSETERRKVLPGLFQLLKAPGIP